MQIIIEDFLSNCKRFFYKVAFVTKDQFAQPFSSHLFCAAARYGPKGSPDLYSTFHPAAIPFITK